MAWREQTSEGVYQVLSWLNVPVEQVLSYVVPESVLRQAEGLLLQGLSALQRVSTWLQTEEVILQEANKQGLTVQSVEELRAFPLEQLDAFSRSMITPHAIIAAVEGGGLGLGGGMLAMVDMPLLLTVNFRLIQQIGAAYGFPISGEAYRPLVLTLLNAAVSGSRQATEEAVREVSVAAALLASGVSYRGRQPAGVLKEQSRHLPREVVKHLVRKKAAQWIPVMGALVGAGVNYWFTHEVAHTAGMLFRMLYLEYKERV